jgi:tetratricopeptide (TPR) repeat protein
MAKYASSKGSKIKRQNAISLFFISLLTIINNTTSQELLPNASAELVPDYNPILVTAPDGQNNHDTSSSAMIDIYQSYQEEYAHHHSLRVKLAQNNQDPEVYFEMGKYFHKIFQEKRLSQYQNDLLKKFNTQPDYNDNLYTAQSYMQKAYDIEPANFQYAIEAHNTLKSLGELSLDRDIFHDAIEKLYSAINIFTQSQILLKGDDLSLFNQNIDLKEKSKIHNNIGVAFYKLGNPDQALSHFKDLDRLFNPIQKEQYLSSDAKFDIMGHCCIELNQIDEAVEYYQKDLDLNPGSEISRNNLHSALKQSGNKYVEDVNYDQAILQFARIKELGFPEEGSGLISEVHLVRGTTLVNEGKDIEDPNEAIDKFNKALQAFKECKENRAENTKLDDLESNWAGTHKNIAQNYLKLGEYAKARLHILEAREIDPQIDCQSIYNSSLIYEYEFKVIMAVLAVVTAEFVRIDLDKSEPFHREYKDSNIKNTKHLWNTLIAPNIAQDDQQALQSILKKIPQNDVEDLLRKTLFERGEIDINSQKTKYNLEDCETELLSEVLGVFSGHKVNEYVYLFQEIRRYQIRDPSIHQPILDGLMNGYLQMNRLSTKFMYDALQDLAKPQENETPNPSAQNPESKTVIDSANIEISIS